MAEITTYVGLDVHKRDIQVAMLVGAARVPVTWQVANEPGAIRGLRRQVAAAAPGPVRWCYEAGPCGYVIQRQLAAAGETCAVIAPALIPRKPGERIKTDRRDARKLAALLRAGLLTEVHPPTAAEESVRDLCRARDAARRDLLRCRHRLSKFLLRQGHVYLDGRHWTDRHRQWIRRLGWVHPAHQRVVDDLLLAVEQLEARLDDLDAALTAVAATDPYRAPVGWLRCFRGIDTLTALLLVAELQNGVRFASARALMAFVGLVPGEHSSGDRTRRGRITKAGNSLVRRLLIEAAWHYQRKAGSSLALRRRRAGQPSRVIALADKAQQRLSRRFTHMKLYRKPAPTIAVAVARELAGFVWAALQPVA